MSEFVDSVANGYTFSEMNIMTENIAWVRFKLNKKQILAEIGEIEKSDGAYATPGGLCGPRKERTGTINGHLPETVSSTPSCAICGAGGKMEQFQGGSGQD